MELDQTTALLSKNAKLEQKNDQLKSTMLSVIKENRHLKDKMRSFKHDTMQELPVSSAFGKNTSSLGQNTFNEKQFSKGLQQTRRKHRTSSPVDFKSFIESSIHAGPSEETGYESGEDQCPFEVKYPERLLGEIAYQLDKRILSSVFQGHKRLYGFTWFNIPNKIIEVSTHPLTGKVDEGYRLHLTQRYDDLKDRLSQLEYKIALHPHFSEFIINTYGILKETSDTISTQADYYTPELLREVIMTVAPRKLRKDLLLLLSCLCNMAEKDGKPLFL